MEIKAYEDMAAVTEAAAAYICSAAQGAVREKGYFTLVLAGGRTPNLLYQRMAEQPYCDQIPWKQTFIFWGDERFVPPAHRDSNYGAAWFQLFNKVGSLADHIYPIPTTLTSSDNAAILYERTIRRAFTVLGTKQFDLTLLGMGDDGHTASIFPGKDAVEEDRRWVVSTESPSGQERVTLTFPLLNESKQILFLVTGEAKKEIFQKVMQDRKQAKMHYPAAMVSGRQKTLWMIDKAADFNNNM